MSFIYGSGGQASQSGIIAIIADSGIVFTDPVILTGDASGAYFTGAASIITESINYVSLPTTTSTVGQITLNGSRFLHNYVPTGAFLGTESGNFSNTAISMVGLGYRTLQNSAATTNACIAIGTQAIQSLNSGTSLNNIAIGYRSFYQTTTASNNVCLGSNTYSDTGTGSASSNNVVIGLNAMTGSAKTNPVSNVIVGANAGTGLTTGARNVLLGDSAGQDITTASSSIRINNVTSANTGNELVIGAGTGTGTQQLNESFIHGIRGITTVNANAIAVLIDSAGQLGTVSSSIRYKENIEDMEEVSSPIKNLRPVTFDFIGKPSHRKQVGLIAEEVKEIMPNLVVHDLNNEVESVKYHDISILLLNELKKALRRVEYLESKLI